MVFCKDHWIIYGNAYGCRHGTQSEKHCSIRSSGGINSYSLNGNSYTDAVSESRKYTEEELAATTTANIKALASELGYSITKTVKADVIAQFLEQQG